MDKNTKSYKLFSKIYEHTFDKFANNPDTVLYNVPYRPPIDTVYEQFVKDPSGYVVWIELDEGKQVGYMKNWVLTNVIREHVSQAEHQLLQESDGELPFFIDNKFNYTHELITEELALAATTFALGKSILGAAWSTVKFTFLGALLAAVTAPFIPDTIREKFVKFIKNGAEFYARLISLTHSSFGALAPNKAILKTAAAAELADSIKECEKISGFNAANSSKLSRAVRRVFNNTSEYEYIRCIGNKTIAYYQNLLETMYQLLKNSNDSKLVRTYEDVLSQGSLGMKNLRNVGRLIRDRKLFTLYKNLEEVSNALFDLIDELIHSNDREYVRIGHELSRNLDNALRVVSMKIKKDTSKPPMNERRNIDHIKDRTDIVNERERPQVPRENNNRQPF